MNIVQKNVPDEINIVLYPQSVEVIFQVALSKFKSVSADMFEVTANFTNVDVFSENSIPLKVSKHPVFVKHIRSSHTKADYIIQMTQ